MRTYSAKSLSNLPSGKTGNYRVVQPIQRALYELEEERRFLNPFYTNHGGEMYCLRWVCIGRFFDKISAETTARELATESATYPKILVNIP